MHRIFGGMKRTQLKRKAEIKIRVCSCHGELRPIVKPDKVLCQEGWRDSQLKSATRLPKGRTTPDTSTNHKNANTKPATAKKVKSPPQITVDGERVLRHIGVWAKGLGIKPSERFSMPCSCGECGMLITDIHHIEPRGMGGDPQGKRDVFENLIGLHRDCHDRFEHWVDRDTQKKLASEYAIKYKGGPRS